MTTLPLIQVCIYVSRRWR